MKSIGTLKGGNTMGIQSLIGGLTKCPCENARQMSGSAASRDPSSSFAMTASLCIGLQNVAESVEPAGSHHRWKAFELVVACRGR